MIVDCSDKKQMYLVKDWFKLYIEYKKTCSSSTNTKKECNFIADIFVKNTNSISLDETYKNVKLLRLSAQDCPDNRKNFNKIVHPECRDIGHETIENFLSKCINEMDKFINNLRNSLNYIRNQTKKSNEEKLADIIKKETDKIHQDLKKRAKKSKKNQYSPRKTLSHPFKNDLDLFEWCYTNRKNPIDYEDRIDIPFDWNVFKDWKSVQEDKASQKRKKSKSPESSRKK